MRRRLTAEALGTFLLVLLGPGSVMLDARVGIGGGPVIAAVFGVTVAVLVTVLGPISGAHVNPAVTVGLWTLGRHRGRDIVPYVAAQCVGAVAGACTAGALLGSVGRWGATVPAVPIGAAFAVEAGYTAVLGAVIILAAVQQRVPPGAVPWAIGGTVFVGAWLTGPLTGGSFNPARSLGPAWASGIWTSHWLYWVAPVVGMVAGMQVTTRLGDRPAAPPARPGAPADG